MYIHVNNETKNQPKIISKSPGGKQPGDNRPETIAQRKLQEMASSSLQVRQLKALQEMANNRPIEKNNGVAQRVINYTNNQVTLQPMVDAIRAQNPDVAALYASNTVIVNISLVQGGAVHGNTTQVIPGNNDTWINNLRAGRGTITITVNNHGDAVQLQQSLLHELVLHAVPIRQNLERARVHFTSGPVVNAIAEMRRLDTNLTVNDALLDVLDAADMSLADFQTTGAADHLNETSWTHLVNTALRMSGIVHAIDQDRAERISYAAIDDAIAHLPVNSQLRIYLVNQYYDEDSD